MDLLHGDYGAASDEELEERRKSSKRHRPLPVVLLPGCYVSKRQRAAISATTAAQISSVSHTMFMWKHTHAQISGIIHLILSLLLNQMETMLPFFHPCHLFKLDKYKRCEKHGVAGFPLKCNFNLSGNILISGSSDGCVYFYDYKSTNLLGKMKTYEDACLYVTCHPVMPNVLATSSWNDEVLVF